jgi:hypothetical protein
LRHCLRVEMTWRETLRRSNSMALELPCADAEHHCAYAFKSI